MNDKDRERIGRLRRVLNSIPFAKDGSGTATASAKGFVDFQNDMHAVLPAADRVLEGMIVERYPDFEPGWDYYDPDIILNELEKWLKMRKDQKWENATSYSFDPFWDRVVEFCRRED